MERDIWDLVAIGPAVAVGVVEGLLQRVAEGSFHEPFSAVDSEFRLGIKASDVYQPYVKHCPAKLGGSGYGHDLVADPVEIWRYIISFCPGI